MTGAQSGSQPIGLKTFNIENQNIYQGHVLCVYENTLNYDTNTNLFDNRLEVVGSVLFRSLVRRVSLTVTEKMLKKAFPKKCRFLCHVVKAMQCQRL